MDSDGTKKKENQQENVESVQNLKGSPVGWAKNSVALTIFSWCTVTVRAFEHAPNICGEAAAWRQLIIGVMAAGQKSLVAAGEVDL